MSEPVTLEQVKALASFAELPLDEDRLEHVAGILRQWLPAANQLSQKMSAEEYIELMPVTVVTQPHAAEGREGDR